MKPLEDNHYHVTKVDESKFRLFPSESPSKRKENMRKVRKCDMQKPSKNQIELIIMEKRTKQETIIIQLLTTLRPKREMSQDKIGAAGQSEIFPKIKYTMKFQDKNRQKQNYLATNGVNLC